MSNGTTYSFHMNSDGVIVTQKWYTIREAAKTTHYSVRTMRQFVYDGKVIAEKHGTKWYILSSDVERLIRKPKNG